SPAAALSEARFRKSLADTRAGLASAYRDRAIALAKNLKTRKEAEDRHRQSLAMFEKLAADFPGNVEYAERIAHGQRWLCGLIGPAEAENRLTEALAIFSRLASTAPKVQSHRYFAADTHRSLAALYRTKGQPAEAEKDLRQAITLDEGLVAET